MVKSAFRRTVIYGIVGVVGLLLLINLVLIYKNSQFIKEYKRQQVEAERVKLNTLELIRALHLLDLGLRGYAIKPQLQFFVPFDSAVRRKPRLVKQLEASLMQQHYTMSNFYIFHEEVNTYFNIAITMRKYLEAGDQENFRTMFDADYGFALQKAYRTFSKDVTVFEDDIAIRAEVNHARAVNFSYWMHAILFLVSGPLLLYLAFYAVKTFMVMDQLTRAEQEKSKILSDQNTTLNEQVQARTNDLLMMNEEITAQNEEILSQNEEISLTNEQLVVHKNEVERQHDELKTKHEQLKDAHATIEQQNEVILRYNDDLVNEVNHQTDYLMRVNMELKERNLQLEQFTYVISHNLRGPMSRIMGLASIIELSKNESDVRDIAQKMSLSSNELDQVIRDLTSITDIRNVQDKTLAKLDLQKILDTVLLQLKTEVDQAQARIEINLQVDSIPSLLSYLENILYNLISNSLKFRDKIRPLVISISSYTRQADTIVDVRDNGLGVDLARYKDQLFIPYKRFHYHVAGRGLGLYMAKTQAEALAGNLEVESTVGEGAIFRVVFRHRS